jgi:Ca2+:H+ antiporter
MAPPRSRDGVVEKRPRGSTSSRNQQLPMHETDAQLNPATNGHDGSPAKVTPGIKAAGESGRSGIHPLHFFKIIFRSSSKASGIVNVLWPLVPAAIAVRYAMPDNHLAIFILAYLAMIPCANLIGFAGQELARKVPHVWGVLIEVTYVFPSTGGGPWSVANRNGVVAVSDHWSRLSCSWC